MVDALPPLETPPPHACEGCILGKIHRFPFKKDGTMRATWKLQLIHSDVCGPMRTPALGGYLYFVTFIDDYSRYTWVYGLKANQRSFVIFDTLSLKLKLRQALRSKPCILIEGDNTCPMLLRTICCRRARLMSS